MSHPLLRRRLSLLELMVIVAVVAVGLGLWIPAVRAGREAARRSQCTGNLKMIALALHNYHEVHGSFPPGVGGGGPAGPRWSVQALTLTYLERNELYAALNFAGVPWGHDPTWSPMNMTALRTQIPNFVCPSDDDAIPDAPGLGHNSYRLNAGTLPVNLTLGSVGGTGANDGPFYLGSATRIDQVTDGTSMTAAGSERCLGTGATPDPRADYYRVGSPVAGCGGVNSRSPRWTNPVEWSGQRWGDGNAFYTRYHHLLPPNTSSCTDGTDDYDGQAVITASSRHPAGVNVIMLDGSIRFIRNNVSPGPWKAMGTIAGGDAPSPADSDY